MGIFLKLPFSDCDGGHEVSGSVVLLAGEVRFSERELVDLGFEVDVGRIHYNVSVEFTRSEPRPSEITRQIASRFHKLAAVQD